MISASRIFSVLVLTVGLFVAGRAQKPSCENTTTDQGKRNCLQLLLILNKANKDALDDKADKQELKNKADTKDLEVKANTKDIEKKANSTEVEKINRSLGFDRDRFWVLLSALLVFFMQAGFLCLEVGMVRQEFDTLQASYKLFSWIATYAGYFIGFGLMFSSTAGNWGLIGLHWPLWPESVIGINGDRGMEFFLFQAAFAATAATIPSGAIAERMSLPGYLLIGFLIALVIYPVFGHWAWGGSLHADELVKATPAVQGWLRRIGFHDFAGSTVVHSIGGWIALIAALTLGPRKGRFQNGLVNVDDFPSRSRGYAFLGVFLLWFGWWGFNGGSQLKYDTSIANIILKTNIAGAAAGFAAWIFACWQKNRAQGRLQLHKDGFIPEKVIGGTLGGLVAITASCDQGNPLGALLIGLAAGVIHNLVFDWLLRREIDDPVGAVPVHLGCGMWGTFCAAFTSSFSWKSVGVQLLGIVIAGGWAVLMGLVLFYLPKRLGKWKPVGEDRLQRVLNLEF